MYHKRVNMFISKTSLRNFKKLDLIFI